MKQRCRGPTGDLSRDFPTRTVCGAALNRTAEPVIGTWSCLAQIVITEPCSELWPSNIRNIGPTNSVVLTLDHWRRRSLNWQVHQFS